MVGAAVVVGVILLWLTTKRLEFTWRISWILAVAAIICASSLTTATRLTTSVGAGIYELAHGFGSFLSHF